MKNTLKLLAILGSLAALPLTAEGEVTYSNTRIPVAVICPNPKMTAYLESKEAPPQFSEEWKSIAGHSHCRSVKNDRPLIVVKSGSVTLHGNIFPMVEVFPGGIIASTDGFGGPYFLLASHIATMPNEDQMRANARAFLPTSVDYSTLPRMGAMP